MDSVAPPRVLVLAGPTAAGKSAAAMAVAQRYGAVIVSADAMQVYRGFDIGTASPTEAERRAVSHVGVDVVGPEGRFSAASFRTLANEAIRTHKPVVVVGGTALYIRALIRGLAPTPSVDAELRARLEALPDLHESLSKVDPELAERLHPNDKKRLIRGLEVWHQTGKTLTAIQAEHRAQPDHLRVVGLWLDHPSLYERIDGRVHTMVDRGYVDEVQRLLSAGVSPECRPMQTLGYRHLCEHLLAGLPLDDAIRRTQRDTRHFARKQRTWRRHLGFAEVHAEHEKSALSAAALAFGAADVAITATIAP